MDHRQLISLFSEKLPTDSTLARWCISIQSFQLTLKYYPGKFNCVAYYMSHTDSPPNMDNISVCENIAYAEDNEVIDDDDTETTEETTSVTYKLLSLGDSYTIGQSVCTSCRFPEQLKDSLINNFNDQDTFSLEIIAQTGWTTTNLKSAIASANLPSDFDLVTLLIGVNNYRWVD